MRTKSLPRLWWELPGAMFRCGTKPLRNSTALELANKLAVFRQYRVGADFDNGGLVEVCVGKAFELEPYWALWALEGLGFGIAERRSLRAPGSGGRSFRDVAPPLRARIPLHTGLGLSLARRSVAALNLRTDEVAIGRSIDGFRAACGRESMPECLPMALEALGLVVRQLRPLDMASFDHCLKATHAEFRDLFWHGVGRAHYFAPSGLLSTAGERLARSRTEPPDDAARCNALAGLAWATTLVNLRHPEVLESVLRAHAADIFDRAAWSHGVSSALLVWRTSHGEDDLLRRFLDHRPAAPERSKWRRWVVEPAREALAGWSELERVGALGSMFGYCGGGGRSGKIEPVGEWDQLSREFDGFFGRMVDSLTPANAG